MYKLCFYVPESHVEIVKEAIFDVGAGRIGDYDRCCWQVLGQGQFRPLAGSNPFLGIQGHIEQVNEYKVELVCEDHLIEAAIEALITAHPYEEPAFHVVVLEEF
ncbi:MAG: NGG1p interacting factor NIF3 [Porticoccaceae bacterium]|jgi:hypothetical protein